ncbi:hypothetical protein OC834_006945 [Tilletia horrida]|nr:hypothetical protein OC834_006945 [Tilletia horrida]KAK0556258.1 hypothetical protein OC844_005903 [Tilletia horrida]
MAYQQPLGSASQLGFNPRAETPGMASPRPSAHLSHSEQDRFLDHQNAGSPYYQQHAYAQRSYFDSQAHTAAAASYPEKGAKKGLFARKPWLAALLAILVIAIIAGAVAGGMFASHSKKDDNSKANTSSRPKTSGSPTASGSSTAAAPTPTITPLARYNWRDPNTVAYGVNIGNWLVIERWLDEDWFTSLCADCEDEWNLSAHLGGNAVPTLQKHYNDFLQESDIDTMKSLGMNMLRVTIGYWAVIDTPGEPFVNAGQLNQLRKLMEWCHARGIYIIISMHGLPGSQSGDQSTGVKKDWSVGGTSWYTSKNQARSDQVITAFANWITQQQPYASVIAAVLPVNEPKQTDADGSLHGNWQELIQDFYLRSYKTLSSIGMVMSIHPGYWQGQDPSAWDSFIKSNNMDPNLVLWETHPYPGYFPIQTDEDHIMNTVCNLGEIHNSISVPVYFGEFSTLSGVTDNGFLKRYWNTQLAAYSKSAGSAFWTWKANNATNPVRALSSNQMSRYDFQFLKDQGIASQPAAGQTFQQYVNGLSHNQCNNQRRRKRQFEHRDAGKARLLPSH